jgi:hypothetical protein
VPQRSRFGETAWHENWYAKLLEKPEFVDSLTAETHRVFERAFGSLEQWTAAGRENQFAALDYYTLRLLFLFVVYRRATTADFGQRGERTLYATMRRPHFRQLDAHWAEAVVDAMTAAGNVRNAGFNAIRANSARRTVFVAQLAALGIELDDPFGLGKSKRRVESVGDIEREKRARN